MRQLDECLNNEYGSYILPFFWQHGDAKDELLEEIEAIEKSGAKEFCVESRIHEDFCKDKWWDDFGFILEEAKKRNMGVWLLDDKSFPTGYANGAIGRHPELKKKHFRILYKDVIGPKSGSALIMPDLLDGERVVHVSAFRREDSSVLTGEPINLTASISDGLVFFDIPVGAYRVFYLIETSVGNARYHMIDILNPDSCMLQISEVYEPHYEHFSEYFGNTFRGFFSDEPCFGNETGYVNSVLGKPDMMLPESLELIEILSRKMGKDREYILSLFPVLWQRHTDKTHEIRFNYMDAVSMLYKRNFSDMLGDWCRSHGVMYIGHIIEDGNLHMRLGAGVGHFFRALSGQDMSGCDIVLNQMVPGFNEFTHAAPIAGIEADPEFFRYTLSKLCVSDAHLDPKKKRRALCEIFGAFGWAEGVPMMKKLADHMLVSGINHFVPHAFTNRFPNADCPPHFYCKGNNPQFDYFAKLTKYMQRMCHLLYGGKHINNVAVLYNCDAEWCAGDYDLFQKASKILLQNQIDFDFVPSDYLENPVFSNGGFSINGETFKTIVVTKSSVLPKKLIDRLNNLSKNGVEVIFCEELPKRCAESETAVECYNFTVTTYENLSKALSKYRDITLSKPCKYLRFCHVENDNKDVYMFSNEDDFNCLDTDITLKSGGSYVVYNAWDNSLKYGKTNGNILNLRLNKSESCVIIFTEHNEAVPEIDNHYNKEIIKPAFNLSLKSEQDFEPFESTDKLVNLASKLPRFRGIIKYDTTINLDKLPKKISFDYIGEIGTLYVNGDNCGDALNEPYEFDIDGKCHIGENKIVVEVAVNLGYSLRDYCSQFLSLPPMGIVGNVTLYYD